MNFRIFIMSVLFASAIFQTPAIATKTSFGTQLLNYCKYMSSKCPAKDSLTKMLGKTEKLKATGIFSHKLSNNQQDSIFSYHHSDNGNVDVPGFFDIHKINNNYLVEIWFSNFEPYVTETNTTLPQFEKVKPHNISFKELITLFGKPVASKIQPKNSYNCHFIYTNPSTKRKVLIKVVSFNPSYSNYNVIQSINIINKELDDII